MCNSQPPKLCATSICSLPKDYITFTSLLLLMFAAAGSGEEESDGEEEQRTYIGCILDSANDFLYFFPLCSTAAGSGEEESDDEEEQQRQQQQQDIEDETGTNLVNLRRTIYLTIMSSLDFEEAGHKLMKIQLAPGQVSTACYVTLSHVMLCY
jgi:hypothetical protein